MTYLDFSLGKKTQAPCRLRSYIFSFSEHLSKMFWCVRGNIWNSQIFILCFSGRIFIRVSSLSQQFISTFFSIYSEWAYFTFLAKFQTHGMGLCEIFFSFVNLLVVCNICHGSRRHQRHKRVKFHSTFFNDFKQNQHSHIIFILI